MRFAHLKVHHGSERMRLRGLSGARDAKQQIAPRMFFLSFGHGGIVQVLVKSDSARLPDCGTPKHSASVTKCESV